MCLRGRPTPIEPEAFKLVAALDTVLMVPALAGGGVLLWRRNVWGYIVAAIAGVQSSLYLLVLSINSIVVRRARPRGLARRNSDLDQPGGDNVGSDGAAVRARRETSGGVACWLVLERSGLASCSSPSSTARFGTWCLPRAWEISALAPSAASLSHL